MKTKFIEAVGVQPGSGAYGNHGKFSVSYFEPKEWARQSEVDAELGQYHSLLSRVGWGQDHFMVTDLQTGEGAIFRLGGYAKADLEKHAIWVCPLFEPFLVWLYDQWTSWRRDQGTTMVLLDFIAFLPKKIEIEYPMEMAGYRRGGPMTLAEARDALDRLNRVIGAHYDLMPSMVLDAWRTTKDLV